ncbi:ABC transporter substrate-binding protein [Arthrobacter castelli]|uniref:ABC transporter substrate-binding protein n=1 Tax=Arthrobacter castelli TaxID=271431 RepID=UPI00041342EA|nr:ABC transporter substrate-binding protein [Arthrobacter castelli]
MRRKIMAAAGAAALALSLSACGGGSTGNESGGGDGKPYVAIVSKGFQHQFWQAVKDGAEKAAKDYNVRITFQGPDTESNVAQQIEMLTSALNKNPDALALAALDSKAAAPLLETAKSKDIPVVAFDSGVDSEIPVSTVATDNKAAAAEAAKHMAKRIGGEGQVAIVAHDQTSKSGKHRRDGFVNWMKKNAPGIEIVDIQYGGGDQLKSTDLAKAMIQANPKLDGLYGTNEGSAIGIVNAVQELGMKGDVTVVGFDSGKAQLKAIRSGLMAGAVTQNPIGIGYKTVETAVKAMKGKDVKQTIDTGYYWYDKENMDKPKIAENLYK